VQRCEQGLSSGSRWSILQLRELSFYLGLEIVVGEVATSKLGWNVWLKVDETVGRLTVGSYRVATKGSAMEGCMMNVR